MVRTQGTQRRRFLWSFFFFKNVSLFFIFFAFDVALFDLVYDVETNFFHIFTANTIWKYFLEH